MDNPLNLSETRAGVEGLKIDESFGSLSLGDLGGLNSSLFKKKQECPKWDGKHRYGTLVVCQKCGRRNAGDPGTETAASGSAGTL